MQVIHEPTKAYLDLGRLRQDLSVQDVKETTSFTLDKMWLTPQGTMEVSGVGEFLLSDFALYDAIRKGGLNVISAQNFFAEKHQMLDEAITNAVNAFYKHSQYSNREVKLITRAGDSGTRVVLGITSKQYGLFTHEQAVEKITKSLSPNLCMKRANLYPQWLELSFTNPIQTVKDNIGDVIEIGLSFYNSQGTKTCALLATAFCLRLLCKNGTTANHPVFTSRYIHRGDLSNSNSKFAKDTEQIFERFSAMMKSFPRLAGIPVTEKLISHIRPVLLETLRKKETDEFIEKIDMQKETAMTVWNSVTNLPHRIQNAEAKLKIENLGFKILTMHLCYN